MGAILIATAATNGFKGWQLGVNKLEVTWYLSHPRPC